MVFNSKKEGLDVTTYPSGAKVDRHIELDSARANELATVKAVFENEVKYISNISVIKIALEYFLQHFEQLPEEEGLELLKHYYKEIMI